MASSNLHCHGDLARQTDSAARAVVAESQGLLLTWFLTPTARTRQPTGEPPEAGRLSSSGQLSRPPLAARPTEGQGGTVMGTHRVRQERACGDRPLTGRIQTVLEVRDLRTLAEDATMIRPPASVRTGAAVMGPPRIGSGEAG